GSTARSPPRRSTGSSRTSSRRARPDPMVLDVQDTVTSGALPVAMGVALLARLLSSASPCVLPLVPGFLGYVTGLSDESLEQRRRHRMVLGALLFVLGFSVWFLLTNAFRA